MAARKTAIQRSGDVLRIPGPGFEAILRFMIGYTIHILSLSATDFNGVLKCILLSRFMRVFPEPARVPLSGKTASAPRSNSGGQVIFVERLPPAMRVRRKKFYLCVEKKNLQ